MDGFTAIRNGLKDHIGEGITNPTDLGVYTFLHMHCNYQTGIYRGSALGIAYGFSDIKLKNLINKSLSRLKRGKYINFRQGDGKRGGYDILIDKYIPTFGELTGRRLNAWKRGELAKPEYEAQNSRATVEQQLSNGKATVEQRLSNGKATVEQRIPYIPDGKDGKDTPYVETDQRRTTNVDPDPILSPSLTETVPGSSPSRVAVTERVPVSSAPAPVLTDIREWGEDRFGVGGERLRNCLIYQLDHSPNDFIRKSGITLASMNREKFIRLLDSYTPLSWTPESKKVKAEHFPGYTEYSARVQRIKAWKCPTCRQNGVECRCDTKPNFLELDGPLVESELAFAGRGTIPT